MRRSLAIKFSLIFFAVFVGSIIAQKIFGITIEDLKVTINSFGIFAPVAYAVILFFGLSVPFAPISDFLTVNLAAFFFPPMTSVIATFFAQAATLAFNYWVGRNFGDYFLKKILKESEAKKVESFIDQLSFRWIFGLRFLLPLTAIGIDAVSYASGIARLRFIKFFLVSLIPWTILNIAYFYSTSFFEGKSPVLFFLPAVVLIALPASFLFIKNKPKRLKLRR